MSDKPILYFKVYCFHQELFGDEIPRHIKDILMRLGTEIRVEKFNTYVQKVDSKFFTYLRLKDFVGKGVRPKKDLTPDMKAAYPWDLLIQSIKEKGIIAPVIAERRFIKKQTLYFPVEGKHRLSAADYVEPHNPDMLIPTILIDRDCEYTEYMRINEESIAIQQEQARKDAQCK